jgi:hypothetical protein
VTTFNYISVLYNSYFILEHPFNPSALLMASAWKIGPSPLPVPRALLAFSHFRHHPVSHPQAISLNPTFDLRSDRDASVSLNCSSASASFSLLLSLTLDLDLAAEAGVDRED